MRLMDSISIGANVMQARVRRFKAIQVQSPFQLSGILVKTMYN